MTYPRFVDPSPEEVRRQRLGSKTVQAYVAARSLFREYSNHSRPEVVTALYEAAKDAMDAMRRSKENR